MSTQLRVVTDAQQGAESDPRACLRRRRGIVRNPEALLFGSRPVRRLGDARHDRDRDQGARSQPLAADPDRRHLRPRPPARGAAAPLRGLRAGRRSHHRRRAQRHRALPQPQPDGRRRVRLQAAHLRDGERRPRPHHLGQHPAARATPRQAGQRAGRARRRRRLDAELRARLAPRRDRRPTASRWSISTSRSAPAR